MRAVQGYTQWIKTFSSTDGLENIAGVAHELGLKVAMGAWISASLPDNERQLANLIAAGQAGKADMVVVGGEVLLRGDVSKAALLAYIARVKAALPAIPVAYSDTYITLLANPDVLTAVDVVLPNYYPYWEGIPVDDAVATVHGWHQVITAVAGGKPVLVGETGWPSAGTTIGQAVPSATNAAKYFLNFASWARQTQVDYFYFEAFDENWKAAYEGPQGAHWGIWEAPASLKPGMQDVFDGKTVADNWTAQSVPGGPGMPTLQFTAVPPYDSAANLQGRALHVRPDSYYVAVYIRVAGSWWVKPTAANPRTMIGSNGGWTADITTGGFNAQATSIADFLLPGGYTPPVVLGAGTLPAELSQNAVATVEVMRSR